MQEDTELLRAIRAGDPTACTAVFETYADRIYRLALSLLKNPAEAEDVVQETCLKGLTHLVHFEGRSSVSTWLYRVAYNASIDRLRRKVDQPLPPDEDSQDGEDSFPTPQNFLEWQTPEDSLLGVEERLLLKKAVDNLPENLQAVFLLRDVEEISTTETAEILGISEALVKVRLHRARLRLRESLASHFSGWQTPMDGSHEM
jgi:RNA polymerase sigma-70 factor (ECF subfamily)